MTTAKPEGSKGKGKRNSEGLIKTKKWTPIATQRSRKPQNPSSIQLKPTLISCTRKTTVISPAVTSKGKLPKSVDNRFGQGTVKGALESQETSQRIEKPSPRPEDLE
ncbi:hypothetical protein O181_055782 [Austropuccinia psidii MF-1]|uniref:Uncharacterized protein n=1 Tax=Austropuccinia psidii MF-1 TaxID=1389203 RepID=A0A9Q3E9I7_9BASI|nr:hypothetical protein [Austropuccinia psidii MF-1]